MEQTVRITRQKQREPSQNSTFKPKEVVSSNGLRIVVANVNALTEIIHSIKPDADLFNIMFIHINEFKDMMQHNKGKVMIETGLQKFTLETRVAPLAELDLFYGREVTNMLQEQASIELPEHTS